MQTVYRPAARVLIVDGDGCVLLMRVEDPTVDLPQFWVTPGGGCEQGETRQQTAIREVLEETGIRVSEMGPCLWHRRHLWRWGERMIDSDEHCFLLQLSSRPEIDRGLSSDLEMQVIREYRWWSVDEMFAAPGEVFTPRNLAALLPAILDGKVPVEPLEIGE